MEQGERRRLPAPGASRAARRPGRQPHAPPPLAQITKGLGVKVVPCISPGKGKGLVATKVRAPAWSRACCACAMRGVVLLLGARQGGAVLPRGTEGLFTGGAAGVGPHDRRYCLGSAGFRGGRGHLGRGTAGGSARHRQRGGGAGLPKLLRRAGAHAGSSPGKRNPRCAWAALWPWEPAAPAPASAVCSCEGCAYQIPCGHARELCSRRFRLCRAEVQLYGRGR